MAMNVHLLAPRSFQGPALAHRMASREDHVRYGDFLARDESCSPADVLSSRAFVSAANNKFAGKELHSSRPQLKPRGLSSVDKQRKVNGLRPEYTSLADVYEKSLRNVLNIQLQLQLDDQPSETLSEPSRCYKASPPHPRGDPDRDYKLGAGPRNDSLRHHRVEEEQRLVTSRYSLQGRTELRNPRRITSSEGSAFHVPSKRQSSETRNQCEPRLNVEPRRNADRYEIGVPSVEYPLYSRAAGYPSNHMGLSRGSGFPYGTHGMYLTSSRDYLDPWHKRRSRDVPPLFPVRCSPIEQRTQLTQAKEYFTRKQTGTGMWRPNSVKDFGGETDGHLSASSKKHNAVERSFPSVDENWTHSAANGRDTLSEPEAKDEKNSGKRDSLKILSSSARYRPYSLKPKSNSSPVNGLAEFKMSTRYRSALKRIEGRKETIRSSGQEGEKEEFLSKLGLEKVEQWRLG